MLGRQFELLFPHVLESCSYLVNTGSGRRCSRHRFVAWCPNAENEQIFSKMSAPVKMTTRGATGKRPVRKSYSSDEDELMPRVVLPIKPPQKKQAAKGTAADKVTGTVGFTSTSPKKRPLPQTPKEEDLAAVVPTPAGTTTDAPKRKKAKTAVTEKEVGRAEQAKPKTAKTAKSPTPETAPSAASATAAAPKKAKADAPKDAAATTSKKTSSKPDLVRERGTFSGIDAEANERGDDGDDGGTGVRRRGEDEEEDEDDGIPLGDDASGLDYFSRRKLASRTSDFTMSRLPHIEDKEIHEALRGFKDPSMFFVFYICIIQMLFYKFKKIYIYIVAASRQELVELHESNFSRWKTEVGLGCNLLFFGFGSKRTLLARFVTEVKREVYQRNIFFIEIYGPAAIGSPANRGHKWVLSKPVDQDGLVQHHRTRARRACNFPEQPRARGSDRQTISRPR